MKPRLPPRGPASIGSSQVSPANKDAACAARVVVLSSPMAWSPPARQRRSWLGGPAGGYATPRSHHLRAGTGEEPVKAEGVSVDRLAHVADPAGAQDVERERAQAGEDAGLAPDAAIVRPQSAGADRGFAGVQLPVGG